MKDGSVQANPAKPKLTFTIHREYVGLRCVCLCSQKHKHSETIASCSLEKKNRHGSVKLEHTFHCTQQTSHSNLMRVREKAKCYFSLSLSLDELSVLATQFNRF